MISLLKYYRIFTVAIMLLLCLLIGSCNRGEEKRFKIGFAQCSGDYWREKTNLDLQLELLNHPEVELNIRNADNSSERQIKDVKYFIDNGYDLIILAPNESDPLVGIVNEAMAKGIPVVTFDRRLASDNFTAHMEVDNYALGRGVVRYAKSLGQRPLNIIEVRGPSSASPAELRHEGFTDAVSRESNMKVLASVFGEWDNHRAMLLTDSLLDIYPEVNMIYAHTDHMAMGAAEALKKRGREDVYVIGIDGFPEQGLKAVSDGRLTATFLYPTEGQRLLKIALAVLNKEPYKKITAVSPLSPVDSSNADILLAQDTLLNEETAKIKILNDKIDQQLERYTSQKIFLWLSLSVLALLTGLLFVLVKSINANRRHQLELMEKNRQLSEEKERQERLYEQVSEATRSKLMFFTNVSHDLRTPLTLIAGPVEQVADDPCLTPQCRSLMRLTRKNVNILRRLIDQILDFRKYENGKAELKLSEVDFPHLLKEWADAFREVARKHDIRLSVNVPQKGSETVAVDVEKMERVFFNLMSNAFKHTPDNGKISVTYSQTEHDVSYSVKDTGSGIDAAEVEKIFDRFYQVEGTKPKGSGIGLALTKAFVELHGGSINVKSDPGVGSEFTVTFPINHTSATDNIVERKISEEDVETELAPVEVIVKDFQTDKPTLLVIDDSRDIQTLIENQFSGEYNVITASDGMQGLKMAVKYVPDIILCDVMMPVMDGMECVKRLKEEVSTSHIPVLMLTACSLDEQRVEGYDRGADAYLSKPFNLEVLSARCRNLLANRRRIKEIYGKRGSLRKGVSINQEDAPAPGHHRPNDVESEFYTRFVDEVYRRISDPELQVADIASVMGLGQSQFTRKIKALTNYTPVELIRSIRLQKARTLLVGTEKTVSEIAYSVGFTSLAYFSKCYKEAFGISPTETRDGHV
ncbi:MAG: substrate-binding domain-containing protein [Bacteroides sp.]|nr:substrate-binding domain-containing protein [Bacteroides sp.]